MTAPRRPWGLIAAAAAVALFGSTVIGYAVIQANRADSDETAVADQVPGARTADYAVGQNHVATDVDYTEAPPVGGPHDPEWADCTGTVYDVDIRDENAVHSLEHGAVWITFDPQRLADADLATLRGLVEGVSGRMLSPRTGLAAPISAQAWNAQLTVDAAGDARLAQFADLLTFSPDNTPELGASCENPSFVNAPVMAGGASRDGGASNTPATGGTGMP